MPSLGAVLTHATRVSAAFPHTYMFFHTLALSRLLQNDSCSRTFYGSSYVVSM